MEATEVIKPFSNEQVVLVCDAPMPNWLRDAMDGSDNIQLMSEMKVLNDKQNDFLTRLEEMKKSDLECVSSIKQAIKHTHTSQSSVSKNCVSVTAKATKISKSMML